MTTPDVTAAGEDPQLEQLWDEFPLDDGGAAAVGDRPVGDQAVSRDTPGAKQAQSQPAAVQRQAAGEANRSFGLAIVAAGITLLIGATGVLLVRAGPLRRPRRALAAAAVMPGSGQRCGVEELVDGLAAEPPALRKSKEVKMQETTNGRQPSDPLSLKAGRSGKGALKSGPSAAERETLKRKSAVETELLKAKRSRDPALLKEKLIAGQRQAVAVKDGAQTPNAGQPAQSPGRGDPGKRRSVRPLRVVDSQEPHAGASPEVADAAAVECEVRWWRGYVNSHFFAVLRGADGPDSILAASSPFRWRKSEPPPQTPATASALASLVDPLLGEGWVVAGRGAQWFAVRLRRAKLHSTEPSAGEFPIHANSRR